MIDKIKNNIYLKIIGTLIAFIQTLIYFVFDGQNKRIDEQNYRLREIENKVSLSAKAGVLDAVIDYLADKGDSMTVEQQAIFEDLIVKSIMGSKETR